jgi:hypothetical protein
LAVQLSPTREAEKRWRYSSVDSSVVGYSPDNNDVSTEAEESPLLEIVAREGLVKTQEAGKGLADAIVICELWRLAVAL